MTYVHDLTILPPPRYDSNPWTQVRIEQSPDNVLFSPIDTQDLDPIDTVPTRPMRRNLTTALATLATGWFRAVLLDADSNESPPSPGVLSPSHAADGYPALAVLLAASEDDTLTALDEQTQTTLRASAINAIERWTGQKFVAEGTHDDPVEKILDGTSQDTLWLPKRLAELVDLTIVGSFLTAADIAVTEDRARLFISPVNLAGGSWLDRAMADISWGEGPASFGEGPGRVSVVGVWGWTEDEWAAGQLDAVERAIRMDMEDRAPGATADGNPLASTVETARELGVSSISQGNVSLTLGAGGEPVVSDRVARELMGLRWGGRSVVVA